MKEIFKKYGAKVAAFTAAASALALPLIVRATVNYTGNLDAVANKAGIQSGTKLTDIIGAFIGTALAILGVLLVLYILYAGFLWMTAAGKEDNVKKAKQIIYQAVIGLFIVFAAYAITTFVMTNLSSISGGTAITTQ